MLSEFDIIYKYFSQLFKKEESLSFKDDCAIFSINNYTVLNVDTIVEQEHFFFSDGPESIAHKLLHVNLSDIASMGAIPRYWSMAITIPRDSKITAEWMQRLCDEFYRIQEKYNFYLIAGDTTFSNGSLTITANVWGEVQSKEDILKKTSAKVGDILCISGVVGDAYWGLQLLKGLKFKELSTIDEQYLIQRYRYPTARLYLGKILSDYAESCTDISDGFWLDIQKLCLFSEVSGTIDLEKLTFSSAVTKLIKNNRDNLIKSIVGGDDYELVFTIKKDKLNKLKSNLPKDIYIQEIGHITNTIKENPQPLVIQYYDEELTTDNIGYSHHSKK